MASNNGINNQALYGFTGTGGTISISTDALASTVNVGTGAAVKTSTFGSTNSTSSTTLQSGSGALSISSNAGAISIASSNGTIGITSGTGIISISTDATATTLNIATGLGAKTVTIGSSTSTSSMAIRGGSGAFFVTSANGAMSIYSGTGVLGISTDPAATTVNVGTGVAVKACTFGSTTASSTTVIQAPSGGLSLVGVDGYNVGSVAKVLTEASNVIGTATITAGSGITVTPTANTITITNSSSGGVLAWTEVTGTSASMAVNNGYIASNAGVVTLTLPASAAVGNVIAVSGKGAGGWLVAQNAGQTIHFGSQNTTTGAGGSLASTLQYDTLYLLCTTANTDFVVLYALGNLTVV